MPWCCIPFPFHVRPYIFTSSFHVFTSLSCSVRAQAMEEESAPWELLYNLGTALLQRGEPGDADTAEQCLSQAEDSCRQVNVLNTSTRHMLADPVVRGLPHPADPIGT